MAVLDLVRSMMRGSCDPSVSPKRQQLVILRSYYLFGSPGLTDTLERGQIAKEVAKVMTVLLIEPILDRYVAQAERREKDWSPKEVEALLLKLRKEILDCLK
jgi:hypothetical protein